MWWPFHKHKPVSQPADDPSSKDLPVLDEHGEPEDPRTAAIVNEVFRTGKSIFREFDEEGHIVEEKRG